MSEGRVICKMRWTWLGHLLLSIGAERLARRIGVSKRYEFVEQGDPRYLRVGDLYSGEWADLPFGDVMKPRKDWKGSGDQHG